MTVSNAAASAPTPVTTSPAPTLGRPTDITTPCTHHDGDVVCGATPTRRYLLGGRCAAHTPCALAGHPEPKPDPALTLAGLRAAAGLRTDAVAPLAASSLTDERAIASGKRRAAPHTYRAARDAEQRRRADIDR